MVSDPREEDGVGEEVPLERVLEVEMRSPEELLLCEGGLEIEVDDDE